MEEIRRKLDRTTVRIHMGFIPKEWVKEAKLLDNEEASKAKEGGLIRIVKVQSIIIIIMNRKLHEI